MKRVGLSALLLATIAAPGCAPPPSMRPADGSADPAAYYRPIAPLRRTLALSQVPDNRVVIKIDQESTLKAAEAAGVGRVVAHMPAMDAVVLEVSGDPEEALAALRDLPGVVYTEREGRAVVGAEPQALPPWLGWQTGESTPTMGSGPSGSPNDPQFGNQWGYEPIGAVQAWMATTMAATDEPVTIAILDSGIDQNHEDLEPGHQTDDHRGKIYRDINFSNSNTADDRYGHGTHVAGIASAISNNRIGVAGTAASARLLNVKVIGDNGIGYDSWIAAGIRWAVDNGADILNMSFSQTSDSKLMREAIEYAASKGVLMVSAAGNDSVSEKRYPAAYPQVMAIAATRRLSSGQERKASFSNYDAGWVDMAAPGDGILSTLPNHVNVMGPQSYGTMNGTSMATPFVSGSAALLWQLNGGNAAKVRARLEQKSDMTVSGSGTDWKYGRLNLYRAMQEP